MRASSACTNAALVSPLYPSYLRMNEVAIYTWGRNNFAADLGNRQCKGRSQGGTVRGASRSEYHACWCGIPLVLDMSVYRITCDK